MDTRGTKLSGGKASQSKEKRTSAKKKKKSKKVEKVSGGRTSDESPTMGKVDKVRRGTSKQSPLELESASSSDIAVGTTAQSTTLEVTGPSKDSQLVKNIALKSTVPINLRPVSLRQIPTGKEESLRWEGQLSNAEQEAERIRIYKMNRRKRYLAYAQGKGMSFSFPIQCSESKDNIFESRGYSRERDSLKTTAVS